MPNVKKLTVEDVILIRRLLSNSELAEKDSFGMTEPLDLGRLESAITRQTTGHGGKFKYNTVEEIGATLFYGIVMNHAFENGNKRTGLIVLLVFLEQNRRLLIDTDEDELYEFTRSVASHEVAISSGTARNSDSEIVSITKWIEQHTRDKVLGDRIQKFSKIKTILENLGCTFDSPNQNFIKIHRHQYTVTIGYPGPKFDVDVKTIKKIRNKLKLSEVDGTDSASFYNYEQGVTTFVNIHRNLLKRLADL